MHQFWSTITVIGIILLISGYGGQSEKDFVDRMTDEHDGDSPIANASQEMKQSAEVSGREVRYATVNGEEIMGYLSKPEGEDSAPGIIVIHEWWGLNDNIRMMTERLAGEGYTALAVDLYNGKVADTPDSAGTYARSVKNEEALDNLAQAYGYLTEQEGADKMGVIGWCFGGGWSLQMALTHPPEN